MSFLDFNLIGMAELNQQTTTLSLYAVCSVLDDLKNQHGGHVPVLISCMDGTLRSVR